jgi:hypothetical protein
MKEPKYKKGDKVRLRHEVRTKGGTVFKSGLVMTVIKSTASKIDLCVRNPDTTKIFADQILTIFGVGNDEVDPVEAL